MSDSFGDNIAKVDEDETGRRSVTMDEVLEVIGMHHMQWMVILLCGLIYGYFAAQTLVPTFSITSLFAMWPELADRPVYFNTVLATGAFCRLVGSLFFLPFMDRFGRRIPLTVSLILSIIVSGLSSSSKTFEVYVFWRSLTALITSILPAASIVYGMELMKIKYRAYVVMTCQCLGTLYVAYGSLIGGALGIEKQDPNAWRWLPFLLCVPALLSALMLIYTRLESPRFLVAVKGDHSKAWSTLAKLQPGGRDNLYSKLGVKGHQEDWEKYISLAGVNVEHGKPQESLFSDILTTLKEMGIILIRKEDALLTYSLILTWALQAFSHWGLSAYMTRFYSFIGVDVTWTTTGSYLAQLPGHALLYFMCEGPLGRIGSIKICALLCTITHLCLALLLKLEVRSKVVLMINAMMCFFFGAPLWGPLYTYSAERYPTTIRSSAMGLFASTASIATIITTYIGSVSLDAKRPWIYPLVWGFLRFGIVFLAFCWKVETKSASLPDREDSRRSLKNHESVVV